MSNLITLQEISEKRDRKSFNSGIIVAPRSNSAKFSLQDSNSQNGSRSTIGDDLQESLQRGREGLDDESKEEEMEAIKPVIPMAIKKKESVKEVVPFTTEKKEEKKAPVTAENISLQESKDLHGEKPFCEYDVKQGLDDETKEESMKARTSAVSTPTEQTAEPKPVIPIISEKKEEKKATVTTEKISLLESKDLHGEKPFCEHDVKQGLDDETKEESMKARKSESAVPMTTVKTAELKPVIPISMEKKEYERPTVPIISEKKEEKKATVTTEKINMLESKDLHGEKPFCEYEVEKISKESQIQGSAPIIVKEVRA